MMIRAHHGLGLEVGDGAHCMRGGRLQQLLVALAQLGKAPHHCSTGQKSILIAAALPACTCKQLLAVSVMPCTACATVGRYQCLTAHSTWLHDTVL